MSDKNYLTEKIINKIKVGEVKMKPKIYFILKTVFIVLSIVVAALFVLFLTSFIFFSLRAGAGPELKTVRPGGLMPGHGLKGMFIFIRSLPWLLIIACLLLIAIMEIMVKKFSFTYRKPILYSLIIIIALVLSVSWFVSRTGFHQNIFLKSQKVPWPVIENFYQRRLPRLPRRINGFIEIERRIRQEL